MASPESGPGSLAVEVTTRCNRACEYCYNVWHSDPGYPEDELDAPELIALTAGALRDSGLGMVQLTGGEPCLRPDLLEIAEGILRYGAAVSLVTDGGLIDERLADQLARLRVGPVQPTLLAGRREVHDEIKGAECFDATVAAIGRLTRRRIPVSVAFVCTRRNHDQFRSVVELCFALGVRTVAFSRFCAAGRGGRHHQKLMPSPEMIAGCLDVAQWANTRLGMKVRVAISLPLCCVDSGHYPDLGFGRCAVTGATPGFTIDPSGGLRACSISPTVLGDLRRESWQAILDRARDGYFRRMTTPPEACRDCDLLQRCGGGCRETALTCFGTTDRPDPLARIT